MKATARRQPVVGFKKNYKHRGYNLNGHKANNLPANTYKHIAEIIENAFTQKLCKFAMVNSKINRQKVITNKRQSKSRRAQIFAPKSRQQ